MPDQKIVLVEVLYGTQMPAGGCSGCAGCGGGCAPDDVNPGTSQNFADATNIMAEELKKEFGDKVQVQYVDVDKRGLEQYPIMNRVLAMGYPYPVTLINGKPKFAGAIMTEDLIESLREELK